VVESDSIVHHDLNKIKSTTGAVTREERVLILTPLKDASAYLAKYFELLAELTYPHHLIDLAFLVSDSSDDTTAALAAELDRTQKRADIAPFRSATIITKDFGYHLSQDVNERHLLRAQAPRRIALGRARNYLLYTALKPEHSWVYWRDADIVECPPRVIEDLIAHDRDIIVPNIWFHRLDKDGVDIEGRCECFEVLLMGADQV
jgi:glycosyltransferase involved in cell wall biosynthesis